MTKSTLWWLLGGSTFGSAIGAVINVIYNQLPWYVLVICFLVGIGGGMIPGILYVLVLSELRRNRK